MKKLLFIFLGFVTQLTFAQPFVIRNNDPRIHYQGRVNVTNDATELSWSGNSAKISFNGTYVKAVLKDQYGTNYYKVIVDGKVLPRDLQVDATRHIYTLVSDLPAGRHTLELFKRTEWLFGKTWLYQFELDQDINAAPETHKRKIEFYGNSITCGYAVNDTTGQDRGTGPFEDNYISYAALTARHFNAEYSCIARSGIGMMLSWFPLIMPEMYDRQDAADSTSKWDFKKYTPDVVVINIFQNDSWLIKMPDNAQFKARFGTTAPAPPKIIAAYQDFVKNIRTKYPQTHIICVLGNMDATKPGSEWPGYITKAVAGLHDSRVTTHFFPFKNTNGHPNKTEQQAMANSLISYIDKNIKW